jgi:hypothetical protein
MRSSKGYYHLIASPIFHNSAFLSYPDHVGLEGLIKQVEKGTGKSGKIQFEEET